jgi:antitoxin (DNA-binding transcriptional repressor) of toxin-antitoxin stability system
MVELRQRADAVLRRVAQGKSFELTYRGKVVARLEPATDQKLGPDDKFYSITDHADDEDEDKPLTNQQIDELVYGK